MGWVWKAICKKGSLICSTEGHNHIERSGLGIFIVKTHADKLSAKISL
jgi:hypothetical protein